MQHPVRNDATIQAFFDQWEVYQRLIENDYMSHGAIHAHLRKSLSTRRRPFTVLDLGCGDASVMATTLQGLPITTYIGVDLSQVALDLAKKRYRNTSTRRSFVQANLVDYLARSAGQQVDVAIAGFAIHHLKDEEKRKFFSDCLEKLTRTGDLYVFDVFKRHGQRREDYLTSYCGMIERGWKELSIDEIDGVCEHIRESDFPVSFREICALATEAGFQSPAAPLYTDESGFHQLCRFVVED